MTDVDVALQTIVAIRIQHASMNNHLHLAAWASEGRQGAAAATCDVVVFCQIAVAIVAQGWTAFLPLLLSRNTLVRFMPEILAPAVGFE